MGVGRLLGWIGNVSAALAAVAMVGAAPAEAQKRGGILRMYQRDYSSDARERQAMQEQNVGSTRHLESPATTS